jgi:hypothetical protein
VRLDQDGSFGFTPQVWDVAGNEANFFIRDVTGGSRLPFRIRPGAPSNSLFVNGLGNIGLGTDSPTAKLTLADGNMLVDNNRYVQFRLTSGSPTSIFWLDTSNDVNFSAPTGRYFNLREGGTIRMSLLQGRVGIGIVTPSHPLHMASGAHVTAGGVWTNASSRAFKQDIAELPAEAAVEAFDKLMPVTFAYKAEPNEKHVGFIAEDVPEILATAGRQGLSPMDIVAVLTKVLQQQQHTIAEQQAALAQLQARVAQLENP